jgi:alkylhydroperoxidase/carboxymuconolactone decarboxylase family protein YurZ
MTLGRAESIDERLRALGAIAMLAAMRITRCLRVRSQSCHE